jgi:Cu(I)/Ag(I) efflux system periplasmic protein CusF
MFNPVRRNIVKSKALILTSLTLLTLTASPAFAEEMHMHSHNHMEGMTTAQGHQGKGIVNSVDAKAGKVNLTHEPIASLNWPAMTMDLDVMEKSVLNGLKAGQNVTFNLVEKRKGKYVISVITVVK